MALSIGSLNESQFGGNTGRQGIYDPQDPNQSATALARLKELYSTYGNMLEPGYTGKTGMSTLDDYSKWQNAIVEAQNISRIAGGKGPMNVEFGGSFPARSLQSTMFSPGQSSAVTGKTYEQEQAALEALRKSGRS